MVPNTDTRRPLLTPADSLLQRVERFLARTGMSASAFGKGACNDPNLVFQLRAGRELRSDLFARVRQFMAARKRS